MLVRQLHLGDDHRLARQQTQPVGGFQIDRGLRQRRRFRGDGCRRRHRRRRCGRRDLQRAGHFLGGIQRGRIIPRSGGQSHPHRRCHDRRGPNLAPDHRGRRSLLRGGRGNSLVRDGGSCRFGGDLHPVEAKLSQQRRLLVEHTEVGQHDQVEFRRPGDRFQRLGQERRPRQHQFAARSLHRRLDARPFQQNLGVDGRGITKNQRHLLAQIGREVGDGIVALGRGQKRRHILHQLQIVVALHKGRGQHVEIAQRQHAPGGAATFQPAESDGRKAGHPRPQTAQRRRRAAHLGRNLAADAARAIQRDALVDQPRRLVQIFAQENIGKVAVVFGGIVEIVVVKDDAKRLAQIVDVLSQITHHIRVADQQQMPAVRDKPFDQRHFRRRPEEERAGDHQRAGVVQQIRQVVGLVGEVQIGSHRQDIHAGDPEAQPHPAPRQRRGQRLELAAIEPVAVRQIDDDRAGTQLGASQERLRLQCHRGRGRHRRRRHTGQRHLPHRIRPVVIAPDHRPHKQRGQQQRHPHYSYHQTLDQWAH